MSGKPATSTSTIGVPSEVLARYNSVNATAESAAQKPFQQYSADPSAFVAPLSDTQQAGIQNTNNAAGQAQPYYGAATAGLLGAQGLGSNYYQRATNELQGAQANGRGFYSQASGALHQGQRQGQNLYDQSTGMVNSGLAAANPLNSQAVDMAHSGTGAVNPNQIGASQINQFMNPYLSNVVGAEAGLLNQNNQQAMAGQLGNAINSGAFGGDRSGIAASNLSQQQNLANANIYSGLLNQGFNTALGAAQQQQGVNLGAQEANRAAKQWGSQQLANIGQQEYSQGLGASQQLAANAQGQFGMNAATASGLQNIGQGLYGMGSNTANSMANYGQGQYGMGAATANSLAGLGAGSQSAALQGATAQLSAGQQQQSTQQAGLTSLYNQFLQQQAYPFQTAQFLANIAEGTGSLSGSTTTNTQPTGLFGNLLSDRRAKEDIKHVGRAKNGLKIYTFKYKGDENNVTHLGFMADEVEKKHPEAVGLAGGLKTVDYDRAARADGGGLVFDPNAGQYGLGAAAMPGRGTYVPAPTQSAARRIMLQANPPAQKSAGLGDVADQYKTMKGLYNDGSQIWGDGKKIVSGLSGGTYSQGGLALARAEGGPLNDPFSHESDQDLARRQAALRLGEWQIANAPNHAANGPVSAALSAQESAPRYSLNAPPAPNGNNGSSLGQLAGLAKMGADVAPYLAMFLKSGGLVAPEHHADGDIVGDNPHGDGPGDTVLSPEAIYDASAALHDRRPLPNSPAAIEPSPGLAPDPQRAPYRPKHMYADEAAPMPPERPAGLGGVSPAAVAAMPGLAASSTPTFHYRPNGRMGPDRIMDTPASEPATAGLAPSDRAMTGLADKFTQYASLLSSGDPQSALRLSEGLRTTPYWDVNHLRTGYGSDTVTRPDGSVENVGPHTAISPQDAERDLQRRTAMAANSAQAAVGDSWKSMSPGQQSALTSVVYNYGHLPPDIASAGASGNPRALAQAIAGHAGDNDGVNKERRLAEASAVLGSPASAQSTQQHPQQQSQQPGLLGSLGSFLHGQPDGQSSPNGGQGERALMAVLSGLGAVGSYKGQSPLGAILQGLGAGAHGWMDSGKQQADIAQTQANTGLTGAETSATNVNAARNSILPESQMYIGPDGRVHYIDKNIAGRGLPLLGGKPNASTSDASVSGGNQPPPIQKPELTGIGYDKSAAQNEILVGPQSRPDVEQSAAYQAATQQAGTKAQLDIGNSRRLMTDLVHAYPDSGLSAPGSGFDSRASAVGALNTAARAFGLGEGVFGNADKGQVLTEKINRLQATMTQQGAGDHTLGALEMYKGINATLDQPPGASAEIASQLMADKMRAKDQWMHMEKFKSDSPGNTVRGAADDFAKHNPAEKYTKEANEIKRLMLEKDVGPYIDKLTSGKYSAKTIAESLQENGYDPNLARYFATGQQ